jgi:antitoxin component HigA of HigAB toxin-antitoxin module
MMKVTPIRNEAAYNAALAEIERLMDAEADTPRGDRLDVLVTLVEAYERRHWSIAAGIHAGAAGCPRRCSWIPAGRLRD